MAARRFGGIGPQLDHDNTAGSEGTSPTRVREQFVASGWAGEEQSLPSMGRVESPGVSTTHHLFAAGLGLQETDGWAFTQSGNWIVRFLGKRQRREEEQREQGSRTRLPGRCADWVAVPSD